MQGLCQLKVPYVSSPTESRVENLHAVIPRIYELIGIVVTRQAPRKKGRIRIHQGSVQLPGERPVIVESTHQVGDGEGTQFRRVGIHGIDNRRTAQHTQEV